MRQSLAASNFHGIDRIVTELNKVISNAKSHNKIGIKAQKVCKYLLQVKISYEEIKLWEHKSINNNIFLLSVAHQKGLNYNFFQTWKYWVTVVLYFELIHFLLLLLLTLIQIYEKQEISPTDAL